MSYSRPIWRASTIIVAALSLLVSSTSAQDVNRLIDRFLKLAGEGRLDEAEETAAEIKRLAEGRYSYSRQALPLALAYQAKVAKMRGLYARAESLLLRALSLQERRLGKQHDHVAWTLNILGSLYRNQGRLMEAERTLKRALQLEEKNHGPNHREVADCVNNLATVYRYQGRLAEAEWLYRRAIAIRKAVLGNRHPSTAASLAGLAALYGINGRTDEAERLFKEALSIYRSIFGETHLEVARSLNNLACAYWIRGRYADAEPLYRRALAIRRTILGENHPDVAASLHNLATLCMDQDRLAEAETLTRQANSIEQQTELGADHMARTFRRRAEFAWKNGRRQSAIEELDRALDSIECQRAHAAGAEHTRARFLAKWMGPFELMVEWQLDRGDLPKAYEAIERGRAQSLLDQMAACGVDLLAGLSATEARSLRTRERESQTAVASLTRQLELLDVQADLAEKDREAKRKELDAKLEQARRAYVEVYAEIRNASHAYRLAIRRDHKPVAFEELAAWASGAQALVFEYFLGRKSSVLLVVSPNDNHRWHRLEVCDEDAQLLGIEAGPLDVDRLRSALSNPQDTGVLQGLRESKVTGYGPDDAIRSAALCRVLIPPNERAAILESGCKQLVVIPDGRLAQLPFETLVVEPGDDPQYLLDVGPPIAYAASATVLLNLAERNDQANVAKQQPVLTIGDCLYGQPARQENESALASIAAGTRYSRLGGRLKPLSFTEKEMRYVTKVFRDKEVPVAWLRREMATERIVRHNVSGRRILHFACHGLVDQAYGNLFGSLALTPGPKADEPSDDGFLTLAEIYELNLKGCELAIPSACDTNAGPEQRGEGVWALSRGFLVAGTRRVVASNWLVDDEAAASLISYFCGGIAQADADGEQPDYAKCLHEAKRWVRKQENWESPYYWAPFVLVGPN